MKLLIQKFYNIGLETRINHKDGLKTWRLHKNKLNTFELYKYNWSPRDDTNINTILKKFPEYDENGEVIQLNHFIRKIVTIPRDDVCSERKVAQLAYNYGQLNGEFKNRKKQYADIDINYIYNKHINLSN